MKSYDPYDVWAFPRIGQLKLGWYERKLNALLLPAVFALDWMAPSMFRIVLGIKPSQFAHVEAMLFCAGEHEDAPGLLQFFLDSSTYSGWGLPFKWYSKNGVYCEGMPYVTNTPYVMEALLKLANDEAYHEEAMAMFHGTWDFLQSLKVMYEGEDALALSYAPVDELRIVVNANSYAAFAYALHAMHGRENIREEARKKATRLVRWVVRQQGKEGEWFYYADREPGNFIDCFHSCFVVKNLIKTRNLLPETRKIVDGAIERGWHYIRTRFYDPRKGFVRRFTVRAHRDPFRWDLYDQAEFLGLLVDFGELKWAKEFAERVEKRFRKGDDWYCRIDIFGRRWGKNFLRWGIAPFWYHRARLRRTLEEREAEACVA